MNPISLALTRKEASALRAWLDVTEPERCGGEPGDDEHDADGYALHESGACRGSGYCPGDVAALDRIANELARQMRSGGPCQCRGDEHMGYCPMGAL